MENLNLVEILKDCPQGTKLYSPIFGEAVFDHITHNEIIVYMKNATQRCFNRYGQYICGKSITEGECMLFPSKDNRDWSKFEFSSSNLSKRKLIEDACKWLRKNADDYIKREGDEMWLSVAFLIRDFKKAMEK